MKFEKPKGKTYLIIAGNYQEFKNFCDNRLHDFDNGDMRFSGDTFIYYSNDQSCRGIRFNDVYNYGTYFLRKDIDYDNIIPSMIENWNCNKVWYDR